MKQFVTSIAIVIIGASTVSAQDLSEAVSPSLLPYLDELAFEELRIQDLRTQIGEITGVRLLCLTD